MSLVMAEDLPEVSYSPKTNLELRLRGVFLMGEENKTITEWNSG